MILQSRSLQEVRRRGAAAATRAIAIVTAPAAKVTGSEPSRDAARDISPGCAALISN